MSLRDSPIVPSCYTPQIMPPMLHLSFVLVLVLAVARGCGNRPSVTTPTTPPVTTSAPAGTPEPMSTVTVTVEATPTPNPTLSPSAFSSDLSPLEVGEVVPGFVLEGLDGGGEVSLEGLEGKVVVLNFGRRGAGRGFLLPQE